MNIKYANENHTWFSATCDSLLTAFDLLNYLFLRETKERLDLKGCGDCQGLR